MTADITQSHRRLTTMRHTTWIDNFSKTYAAGLQGVMTPSYAECLWTGVAVRPYAGDRKLIMHPDQQKTDDCMPADLFTGGDDNKLFQRVVALMQKSMTPDDDGNLFFMEKSWCFKWKINSVPLKPQPGDLEDDRLNKILSESRDGMEFFRPQAILPLNVGSNVGLLQILRDRMNTYKQTVVDGNPRLDIINSDPNIFARIIKVAYVMSQTATI
jgi:hypothetical protein